MRSARPSACSSLVDKLAYAFNLLGQNACLAPQAVFIEDDGPGVRPFAAALDRALSRQLVALPPRTLMAADIAALRSAREALVVRQALGEWVSVLSPVDRLVPTVAIEPMDMLTPSPLDRFVRIAPAPDGEAILAALRPVARYLQCIALATGPGDDGPGFERQLARLGASRICPRASWASRRCAGPTTASRASAAWSAGATWRPAPRNGRSRAE
mgnify:FL=1